MENSLLYKKHCNCEVKAVLGPFGPHYAKLVCKNHNKLIQWLNQSQYNAVVEFAL